MADALELQQLRVLDLHRDEIASLGSSQDATVRLLV